MIISMVKTEVTPITLHSLTFDDRICIDISDLFSWYNIQGVEYTSTPPLRYKTIIQPFAGSRLKFN